MKIILPILILFAGIVVTMVIGRPKALPEAEPEPIPVRLVETLVLQPTRVQVRVESQGFVKARTTTRLSSEVSGKVLGTSKKFFAGELVRKGDVLARVDPSDYEAAVSSAEARLASQQVALVEEEARVEQARVNWERVGKAEASKLTLREPQLIQAKANVKAAQSELSRALRDLERTQITAPFDALVKSRDISEGQFLGVGGAVGELLAIDYAEVRLPILMDDIPFLRLPSPLDDSKAKPTAVLTSIDGESPFSIEGQLIRTENRIDEDDRVLYAIARIPDPYGWGVRRDQPPLIIGKFVTVELETIALENVFRIPKSAIKGTNSVAIIESDDTISFRDIGLLYIDRDYVYTQEGIESGMRLCLTSPQTLYEGTPVSWNDSQSTAE
ncbi:MAG: efflux RND transporter periplasmic adaptor subunit [Verrucomicrobiota bacterium]